MNPIVMEMVTFKLKTNTTPMQCVTASETVNAWAQAQPGFISRALSQGGDGMWFDVVYWQSAADAQAASQQFMVDLAQSDFMAMIDPATVNMTHAPVVSRS